MNSSRRSSRQCNSSGSEVNNSSHKTTHMSASSSRSVYSFALSRTHGSSSRDTSHEGTPRPAAGSTPVLYGSVGRSTSCEKS